MNQDMLKSSLTQQEKAKILNEHLKIVNEKLKLEITCITCLDNPRNIVILPCGHICCCHICTPRLDFCPICRQFIRGTVKIYPHSEHSTVNSVSVNDLTVSVNDSDLTVSEPTKGRKRRPKGSGLSRFHHVLIVIALIVILPPYLLYQLVYESLKTCTKWFCICKNWIVRYVRRF